MLKRMSLTLQIRFLIYILILGGLNSGISLYQVIYFLALISTPNIKILALILFEIFCFQGRNVKFQNGE